MTDILIMSKKQGKHTMKFKVDKKVKKRSPDPSYQNVINVKDANQLATVLEDLELLFDAPLDKAFDIKKNNKKSPFW